MKRVKESRQSNTLQSASIFQLLVIGALLVSSLDTGSCSAELLVPPCPPPHLDTKDWRKIGAMRFTFLLPPDFREVAVQPIDSYARQFQSRDSTTVFGIDMGSFSNPLTDNDGRQTEWCSERIGGRMARIISSTAGDRRMKYMAAAAWRDVTPNTHLTMWGSTKSRRGVKTLLAILRTVRFAE